MSTRERSIRAGAAGLTLLASASLLGGPAFGAQPLPQGSDPVTLDPAEFGGPIDNPYWPMTPGTVWTYRETDADGAVRTIEVTVTDQTRRILGIDAVVVHDVVTEDGELVEDTLDWYAQDRDGNVWYLGEETAEYEGGAIVTTEGSWEAGVDGAQAGIVMLADPSPGTAYRQEYLAGEAEDGAQVVSTAETVAVPMGTYEDVLMTRDFTTLHPEILEVKLYAPGVGPILEVGVSGGTDRAELTMFQPG